MAEDPSEQRPLSRVIAVVAFVALCVGIFAFLWVNSGGRIPLASTTGYEVTATMPRVSNAVYFSDVMIAGVKVGKVRGVKEHGDHSTMLLELDQAAAPLHEGALFEIRAKSLVEESFVSIVDGNGPVVDDHHVFGLASSKEAVRLDDVLDSLDAPTRASLTSTMRSAGLATDGSKDEISSAVEGLGQLGREGRTALDALADQSDDLTRLTRSSTRVLSALAERRAQLSSLVTNADRLTDVTSGQRDDLEATIRALPPLMKSARDGSDDLRTLADRLDPVARNLKAAAPDLTAALRELPQTSADLRGLLPALDQVVDSAPRTLTRVPTLSEDIIGLTPPAEAVLADLNPVLGYVEPYGRDVAAWFTNFAQTIATGDVNGRAFRVMGVFNEQNFKGLPVNTNIGALDKYNPLPAAGSLTNPGPFRRDYTRVTRDAIPKK